MSGREGNSGKGRGMVSKLRGSFEILTKSRGERREEW